MAAAGCIYPVGQSRREGSIHRQPLGGQGRISSRRPSSQASNWPRAPAQARRVLSLTDALTRRRAVAVWRPMAISLRSGLRLDESFRHHFESGYALDKACFQLADAINQA